MTTAPGSVAPFASATRPASVAEVIVCCASTVSAPACRMVTAQSTATRRADTEAPLLMRVVIYLLSGKVFPTAAEEGSACAAYLRRAHFPLHTRGPEKSSTIRLCGFRDRSEGRGAGGSGV